MKINYCAWLLLTCVKSRQQTAKVTISLPHNQDYWHQQYCGEELDKWDFDLQQREKALNEQTRRNKQNIQEKLKWLKIREVWYKTQIMRFPSFEEFTPEFKMLEKEIELVYPFPPIYKVDPFFNNKDPNINTCPYNLNSSGIKGYRDYDVLINVDKNEIPTCQLAQTPNRIFHTTMGHCQHNDKRGQCTEWADGRYYQLTGIHAPFHDHAGNWSKYAPYEGWVVSKTPIVPSIMVLAPQDNNSLGHVAVVENVYPKGYICTSHWNAPRPRLLTVRQEPIRPEYNFIYHPNGVANYYSSFSNLHK